MQLNRFATRDDIEHGWPTGTQVAVRVQMDPSAKRDYDSLNAPKPNWVDYMEAHPGTKIEPPNIRLKPVEETKDRVN